MLTPRIVNNYDPVSDDYEQKYGKMKGGKFTQRNLNIAPFYRDYCEEKRKVNLHILNENMENAK